VDLDRDPIPTPATPYGWIVLADVLEHLREPEALLSQCQKLLADDGRLVVSVPNVAHWSVRLSLLFGRFSYTARGILDRSHLRFYTLSTIQAELERAGFSIERVETTSPPFQELIPGGAGSSVAKLLTRLNYFGNAVWKQLFAYQFVLRARKVPGS
jgi:SAM-dependent methyltransferase